MMRLLLSSTLIFTTEGSTDPAPAAYQDEKCHRTCKECTGDGKCASCYEGYKLSNSGTCEAGCVKKGVRKDCGPTAACKWDNKQEPRCIDVVGCADLKNKDCHASVMCKWDKSQQACAEVGCDDLNRKDCEKTAMCKWGKHNGCASADCLDDDGWSDSNGDGCNWYSTTWRCDVAAHFANAAGVSARQACCKCSQKFQCTLGGGPDCATCRRERSREAGSSNCQSCNENEGYWLENGECRIQPADVEQERGEPAPMATGKGEAPGDEEDAEPAPMATGKGEAPGDEEDAEPAPMATGKGEAPGDEADEEAVKFCKELMGPFNNHIKNNGLWQFLEIKQCEVTRMLKNHTYALVKIWEVLLGFDLQMEELQTKLKEEAPNGKVTNGCFQYCRDNFLNDFNDQIRENIYLTSYATGLRINTCEDRKKLSENLDKLRGTFLFLSKYRLPISNLNYFLYK